MLFNCKYLTNIYILKSDDIYISYEKNGCDVYLPLYRTKIVLPKGYVTTLSTFNVYINWTLSSHSLIILHLYYYYFL